MPGIITVRNVTIGVGIPKIIVPIVGRNVEEIYSSARSIAGMAVHIVEWRADFFDEVFKTLSVFETLKGLREILGDIPLMFTFRTANEGGEKPISMEEYEEINIHVAKSGYADLIDVEIFSGDDVVKKSIKAIHEARCFVMGSNHDFNKTPEKNDIIGRLIKMQDMDADILKIAVMPNDTKDVLTLLDATSEMTAKYAKKPVVTMSMSAKGVISRLTGEMFGSAMTFGSAGKNSAPGQIPVEELSLILQILHRSL